jgi:hypothetical protein
LINSEFDHTRQTTRYPQLRVDDATRCPAIVFARSWISVAPPIVIAIGQ